MKSNAFEPSDDDDDEQPDVVDETMRYLLLHGGLVADDETKAHPPAAIAEASPLPLTTASSHDLDDHGVSDLYSASPSYSSTANLAASMLNTARKIIAWCPKGSKSERQHYDFLALATLPAAVDNVIQSIRFASSRRVILQALLRTASIIAADELILTQGSSEGEASTSAGSVSRQQPISLSPAHQKRLLFVDDEGRSLDEAMLHAAVLIIVNADCLLEQSTIDDDGIDEILWVIRWLSSFSVRRSGFVSVSSLVVAFCVLVYCHSHTSASDRPRSAINGTDTQRALRKILEQYRQLYSCYADAAQTINDFYKYFVPDCVTHLRRAIQDLTCANRAGTLFNGKVKGICYSRFRSAVAPFVHQIDATEHSESVIRSFLAQAELYEVTAIRDACRDELKSLRFNQAWYEAFVQVSQQEMAARAAIEGEGSVIPLHIVAKKQAMELLWRDTLWETAAITQREMATRQRMEAEYQRQLKAAAGAFQIELVTSMEQQRRGEVTFLVPQTPLEASTDEAEREGISPTRRAADERDDGDDDNCRDERGTSDLQPYATGPLGSTSPTPLAPVYRALSRGSAELRYQQQRRSRSSLSGRASVAVDDDGKFSPVSAAAQDDEAFHHPPVSPPPAPICSNDVEIEELIEREMMFQSEQDEIQILAEQFEAERWIRYYWTISGDRKPIGTRRVFVAETFTGKAADRHLPDRMRIGRLRAAPPSISPSSVSPRLYSHEALRQPSYTSMNSAAPSPYAHAYTPR